MGNEMCLRLCVWGQQECVGTFVANAIIYVDLMRKAKPFLYSIASSSFGRISHLFFDCEC